jgi:hypothetical protein
MSIYKSPFLEPYTGRLSRHYCPRCKQDKSFTLYIDGQTNRPIHRSVGRCNRENSCAYHYTPREYFRDNPDNGYEKSSEELIKISDLHSSNKEYCFKSNYTPVSIRLFTKRIRNMGIKVDRKSYGMVAYLNNKF